MVRSELVSRKTIFLMLPSTKSANSSATATKKNKKAVPVELGYVEETDSWRLESYFFPSKVGGSPAWLSYKPLPTPDTVRCGICGEVCVFLLQVYAPLETSSSSFHRMVYVFVCNNPQCCVSNKADNFVVLRCQLLRENNFYSSEPLDLEEIEAAAAEKTDMPSSIREAKKVREEYTENKLCAVCSCAAEKQCAECKQTYYCCKAHQELDWKCGGHKEQCGKEREDSWTGGRRNLLGFPELEIIIERERYVEQKTKERSEGDRLRAYEEFMQQQGNNRSGGGGGGAMNGMNEESVQHLEAIAQAADKDFKMFRRRIEQNPEQVLRYQRGGEPLWVNRANTPSDGDTPPCALCGAPRIFEFQIMPHLLSYLSVDTVEKSLDWATVAVYTCRESCDIPESGYTHEWAWKQDFTE